MEREEAYNILKKYLTNQNLIKHSLAAEAAMKAIYKSIVKQDVDSQIEQKWGIVGLLHDADYELSKDHPEKHGLLLFEKEQNIPTDIAHAIKGHNYEYTNVEPQSQMDWAIACCDQLTGLIVAATLVSPTKKIADIDSEFVNNRMKEKSFARGAKREPIYLCEEKLGIPLQQFITIVLLAMQKIAPELGL